MKIVGDKTMIAKGGPGRVGNWNVLIGISQSRSCPDHNREEKNLVPDSEVG